MKTGNTTLFNFKAKQLLYNKDFGPFFQKLVQMLMTNTLSQFFGILAFC